MENLLTELIIAVSATFVVAGTVFYYLGRGSEKKRAIQAKESAEDQSGRIIGDATREGEAAKAKAIVDGREAVLKAREDWESEAQRRREELERTERRIQEREVLIDRKMASQDEQEAKNRSAEQSLRDRLTDLDRKEAEVRDLEAQRTGALERISGISAAEAKQQLQSSIEEEARADAAALVRDVTQEAKSTSEREARKIISLSIQRLAADYAVEHSVSAVALPSDDMKGRIIGREGRNIRAFETATGVDVIIDDTPDTVVLSCFDPVRREIARRALESLVSDGRIHPGRIEEVVQKATEEVDTDIKEVGELAVYELGIHDMAPELVYHVGRMKYRTSYGQNMLQHSIEVARIAASMAAELKLDPRLAKRGALLHDIGKVLTHQHEGTHVELGVDLATKHGEDPVVINCIAAHHDDVPHETAISVIVQAADSASGARPGARGEAVETYVKRLAKLEEIASSYDGVEKSFAIQAGRELRIVVTPDSVDDEGANKLADDIAKRIETEVQYPGQIKVIVIRETRAVGFAR
jgi:ribonuclease Y